jgi:hypothetical protein
VRDRITTGITERAALFRGEAGGWPESAPLRHEVRPSKHPPRA